MSCTCPHTDVSDVEYHVIYTLMRHLEDCSTIEDLHIAADMLAFLSTAAHDFVEDQLVHICRAAIYEVVDKDTTDRTETPFNEFALGLTPFLSPFAMYFMRNTDVVNIRTMLATLGLLKAMHVIRKYKHTKDHTPDRFLKQYVTRVKELHGRVTSLTKEQSQFVEEKKTQENVIKTLQQQAGTYDHKIKKMERKIRIMDQSHRTKTVQEPTCQVCITTTEQLEQLRMELREKEDSWSSLKRHLEHDLERKTIVIDNLRSEVSRLDGEVRLVEDRHRDDNITIRRLRSQVESLARIPRVPSPNIKKEHKDCAKCRILLQKKIDGDVSRNELSDQVSQLRRELRVMKHTRDTEETSWKTRTESALEALEKAKKFTPR